VSQGKSVNLPKSRLPKFEKNKPLFFVPDCQKKVEKKVRISAFQVWVFRHYHWGKTNKEINVPFYHEMNLKPQEVFCQTRLISSAQFTEELSSLFAYCDYFYCFNILNGVKPQFLCIFYDRN